MSSDAPPQTNLNTEITTACQRLYQFTPHEWQSSVIRNIITAHRAKQNTNMILVRPTGGGKSLVYQVATFMNKGVTLFISPLLALASDQMQKLRKKTTNIPHMGSLHLDGMKPSTIKTIADDISHMKHPETGDCSGCMILFVSPQFLVGDCSKPILEAVLNNQSSALHMVVMDEVHIACQFGNTFRGEFRLLKTKLYSKLPNCCKIKLFMTGTCTKTILTQVEQLFGIRISNRHWPTHEDMRHRSVSIKLTYTPLILNVIKSTLGILLKGVTRDEPKKAIIYLNMRNKIITLGSKLGGFLNADGDLYKSIT